jgi:RNA polymerase sigma factor (sigma-70 family)
MEYLTSQFGVNLSPQDIEEIADHSIVQVLVHIQEYRGEHGEKSAWAWVYQIARSQALKWLRTIRGEIQRFPDTDDDPDPQVYYITQALLRNTLYMKTVEEQIDEKLLTEKLIEIVQHLEARDREILYLYFVEGWKKNKIAARLNITPARVTQIMEKLLRTCHGQLVLAGFDSL